jgi:signal transduction histidine kinase
VLFADLAALVKNNGVRADKTLEVLPPQPGLSVIADSALLQRVLLNMLINAFEASEAGGTVRMECERFDVGTSRWLRFKVWNATVIPPSIQLRLFQRHFSTKSEFGRGVGTWSMKLLGEQFLHGRVGFRSEEGAGTTFHLELPAASGP